MVRPRKSAGWRFHGKVQNGMIIYTGQTPDRQQLEDLHQQVLALDLEDVSVFFDVLPPIGQLVRQIPYSLPLLDALYTKCHEAFAESSFPARELACESLFCQLLWWTSYCEQVHHNGNVNRLMPSFQDMEKHVKSLILMLAKHGGDLVERAHSDCKQLALCLESLGCHGLVNCSSGLIRMDDAVYIEVQRHGERIKLIASKLRETAEDKPQSVNPSSASHQRQMDLHLSEILERLKVNETIEIALEETITNAHLSSLLRIVRKRVSSDRLLIGLFNAFARAAPDDFLFEQLDPVVAKLIVNFHCSYQKLLSYINFDGNSTSDKSSENDSSTAEESMACESSRTSIFNQQRKRSKSCNPICRKSPEPSSPRTAKYKSQCKTAKSTNSLGTVPHESNFHSLEKSEVTTRDSPTQIANFKAELSDALRQMARLRSPTSSESRLYPEPDYPDCSLQKTASVVKRYTDLYLKACQKIRPALDELPEFSGSEEVQKKTLFSCFVLTHRSVMDTLCSRLQRIREILTEGGEIPNSDNELKNLEKHLRQMLHRQAKVQRAMSNAKEVASQIWRTLYDFPSLKTCNVFNRFLLECCDLAWDIASGAEEGEPKFYIEYETAVPFDSQMHVLDASCEGSQFSSTVRQVLWPALVEISSKSCLVKAVVIAN